MATSLKKSSGAYMTTWLELSIYSETSETETLNDWLNLLGTKAISTEINNNTLHTKALFLPPFDLKKAEQFLQKNISNSLRFSQKIITEEEWKASQSQALSPLFISESLIIYPSTFTGDIDKHKGIVIDAIDAFGSGEHPTTLQCLQHLTNQDLNGKTFIDFGCGSGILAIAAVKLGARRAIAIDIDEQALQTTKSNIQKNHLSMSSFFIGKEVPRDEPPADLIVANILSNPIKSLAPHFHSLVEKSGEVILAGMLKEQLDSIKDTYQNYFFQFKIKQLGEWPIVTCLNRK